MDRQQAGHGEVSNGKIAFSRKTAGATNTDIYVIDEEGANDTRLTHTAWFEAHPVWSPDGEKIAFVRFRERPVDYYASRDIYVMNADGTDQTRLTDHPSTSSPKTPVWSPDGEKIAFFIDAGSFITDTGVQRAKLYVVNADGTDQTRLASEVGPEDFEFASWGSE